MNDSDGGMAVIQELTAKRTVNFLNATTKSKGLISVAKVLAGNPIVINKEIGSNPNNDVTNNLLAFHRFMCGSNGIQFKCSANRHLQMTGSTHSADHSRYSASNFR